MAMAEEHPWNEQGFLYSIILYYESKKLVHILIMILRYYSHRPYAHNPAGLNGGLLLYNFTRLSADQFNSPTNDLLSVSPELIENPHRILKKL